MGIIHNFGKRSGMGSTDGRATKIIKLKKGEFFRKIGGKKTLVYKGKERDYDRYGDYKGYAYTWQDFDDISNFGKTRKDIDVLVDFDF